MVALGQMPRDKDKAERRADKKKRRPFRVWGRGLANWYRNVILKKTTKEASMEQDNMLRIQRIA